ncbi:hypothetical protein GCM10027036_22040 [Flavihumibacter cheonanensis]|uniref:helix-turn-helix domain-containing protein n=1 Tax=Flavihumibacter cheonanensis TaxID=1442385 RepID=UPI001EF986AF|nr:helix-turn-helix domain-containing protein [Flavihumibacter cheonanensis]MCG7754338.1 AraC family transcriptional regulator [Flavihumibacter cheonanensis]
MNALNLMLTITVFGILQGAILAGLLFSRSKGSSKSNFFLACFVGAITLYLSTPGLQQIWGWRVIWVTDPLTFLVGPFLYLYVISFTQKIGTRQVLLHLLWAIIYYPIVFVYVKLVEPFVNAQFAVEASPYAWISLLISSVKFGQLLFYFLLCKRALLVHKKIIADSFSETSKIDLDWVRRVANLYLILVLISIGLYMLTYRYPAQVYTISLVNLVLLSGFLYYVSIKGLLQPAIFRKRGEGVTTGKQYVRPVVQELLMDNKPGRKYQKSGIEREKQELICQRAIEVLEKQKLYTEPELTLLELADQLKFPPYQVSQSLNECLGKSFYDLVNGYRVKEAKRLLNDPEKSNLTVLSIGFEAGFNSKTTFNSVFKQKTGMTPTAYRKNSAD